MSELLSLEKLELTVFLRRAAAGLEQLVRVHVGNAGAAVPAQIVMRNDAGAGREGKPALFPAGASVHELFLPEATTKTEWTVELLVKEAVVATLRVTVPPPRHWVVHVIQLSHHDVGYTDLASAVLPEHARQLDRALDFVAATRDYPEDARFRLVIEQTWSLDYYLRTAAPARRDEMLRCLQTGDLELTALFGNLTTELCGHEVLARATAHALRLKREHGIPLLTAEHNDIPGVSWGLAEVLCAAGIKLLCPGFPHYWAWGGGNFPDFWDGPRIFGSNHPGAFWWQAPSGAKLLLWCNNTGCGGDCRPTMPGLAERLAQLEAGGYRYPVIRWPVSGGARDNSPYSAGYADTIRHWNEQWAFPHLVCSTNSRFYRDFAPLATDLPTWRGELPGQDYPVGAASTAEATAINRATHTAFLTAERLATMASAMTDLVYPRETLRQAVEEMLWHDEHTWGHHFPCGPTSRAAELEKAVHAWRGATLVHDATRKAVARLADHVRLVDGMIHLVVWNPLPWKRDALVRTPLREIDNCGSEMVAVPSPEAPGELGPLRGMILTDRWPVHLPPELASGNFELVDAQTGARVPYQLIEVAAEPPGGVPHAAQRVGLGTGGRRYGFFERPSALRYDLVFAARELPAGGYRTYRLVPRGEPPTIQMESGVRSGEDFIENEFYRLTWDPGIGVFLSLRDRQTGRELLEEDGPHDFLEVVVRAPDGTGEWFLVNTAIRPRVQGPLAVSVVRVGKVYGHPEVRQEITLYAGLPWVDVSVNLLKDATPLLEAHLAFPFAAARPQYRYEASLSVVEPVQDFLPGAFADRLAVQNWVRLSDSDRGVAWASLDAPVVSLSELWPGRVSPAHSAVVNQAIAHPPQRREDLQQHGRLYSLLFHNNHGTNFSCSQSGDFLFRYRLTSGAGLNDTAAARLGWEATMPCEAVFTKHARPRTLPPTGGLLEVVAPELQLLTCKQAEDGDGWVLRLWNPTGQRVESRIRVGFMSLDGVQLADLGEFPLAERLEHDAQSFVVGVAAGALVTIRLHGPPRTAS